MKFKLSISSAFRCTYQSFSFMELRVDGCSTSIENRLVFTGIDYQKKNASI